MSKIGLLPFIFMAALGVGQESSTTAPVTPGLPLADHNACPNEQMRSIVHRWRVGKDAGMHSSWQDKRRTIGSVKTGEEVALLGAVNVTREPDTALILPSGFKSLVGTKNLPYKEGDVVLRYGRNGEGYWNFWVNGVWFTEYFEKVVSKDGWCGFADKNECTIRVTKSGVKEWWVQVKTKSGHVGWVLADDGTFGDLCMAD
jgi:hypothetical protein